jgi:F-type H+-transporting ATPase subunit b
VKKLILVLLLALPVVVQGQAQEQKEAPHEAAQEKDMIPWMWANFLILAGALAYLSKKYGGPFLAARLEGIRKDIVDAEKTKAEAAAKIAAINARLAGLDSEIAALKEENLRDQARESERLHARHQAELARIQQQTQQEIQSAMKAAKNELHREAAKLAIHLAEEKVSVRMNPETRKKLASDFVESLS